MTATSNPRNTPSSGITPARSSVAIAANTLCLQGTIAVRDADGRAANVANGLDAIGIYSHTYDNRTTSRSSSGAAGEINAEVEFGEFELPYTGTVPKMGDVVFGIDNQTVGLDSNGGVRGIAGFVVQPADTDAGTVRVFVAPQISGAYADVASIESIADAAALKADNLAICEINVPLESFRLASGAALPAFNDGVADGFALNSSEGFGYVFNVASTGVIWGNVRLPADLDESAALEIHFLAARIGALDTTAAITVTAFGAAAGTAFDAGANLSSGNTGAIAGATKVPSDVHVTANGATAGQVLSFSAVPTAALDADDLVVLGCWIKCTRTGA